MCCVFRHFFEFTLLVVCFVGIRSQVSETEYSKLPKIYELEDFDKCRENHYVYCRVTVQLSPINEKNISSSWSIIQKMKNDRRYFGHDKLYHGVCFEKYPDTKMLESKAKQYSRKYSHLELKAKILEDPECSEPNVWFNEEDILPITLTISIIIITIFSTYTDWKQKYIFNKSDNSSKCNKYLKLFSVLRNLEIIQKSGNKKFLFLEGIRTYTMFIVIFFHCLAGYAAIYMENTEYWENFYLNSWRHAIVNWFNFVVQTYLIMSSMLLSIQILELHQNKGEFSLHDALLIMLNRFLRILPSVAFLIAFHKSNIPKIISTGVLQDIVDREYKFCSSNWWITLLFLNNQIRKNEMCNSGAWYLSVDVQMYMVSVIILYIILKFKLKTNFVLCFIATLAIIYNATQIYINNYDVVYLVLPKTISFSKYILTDEYITHHMSTPSNQTTYFIGILFAHIYFQNKNTKFFKKTVAIIAWYGLCFTLPILALYLSLQEFPRLLTAIVGSLVKPIYSLGTVVLIFGLLTGGDGIVKKILEWKPAIFLANFTFSTYLFHFGPVLGKITKMKQPFYLSDFFIFKSFLGDLLTSYAAGIIMFFILEFPVAELQKMLVPKVQRKKTHNKTE